MLYNAYLVYSNYTYYAPLQRGCKKRLSSSCLVVHLSLWKSAVRTGRVIVKFCVWDYYKNLPTRFRSGLESDKNRHFSWWPTYIYESSPLLVFVNEAVSCLLTILAFQGTYSAVLRSVWKPFKPSTDVIWIQKMTEHFRLLRSGITICVGCI
jgi:hypothetical protein